MKNSVEVRKGLSGTFALNKQEPIHRWYKYDEGYSSELILNEFNRLPIDVESIFEPFAGSGTTPLVAAQLGIESYFTEINPFMAYITETKINTVRDASNNQDEVVKNLAELKSIILDFQTNVKYEHSHYDYQGFEKYYDEMVLNNISKVKWCIENIKDPISKKLARVALSAIAVKTSKMIKRGDLRYAKENEKNILSSDVFLHFLDKLNEITLDITNFSKSVQASTQYVHSDARQATLPKEVDCVITSPPYLNGTNYIRNTKLELQLLNFINSENDLPLLHSNGIMAGINSVSRRRSIPYIFEEVKPYVERLEAVAYDKRIPIMVGGYFYDMHNVFQKLKEVIRNNGVFVLDIGDSQFAGVHIPTDILLSEIAKKNGFELYDEETLRTRRSKNQMLLSQKVLRYRLKK
ncbi:site-specific DNA-methyltransferase [Paenibacillus sp. Lou8.1]|uniref:site-specific DNA-methyltransferase n=1 Tax=Paenibacillus sp. Lou8.1 TaxID=2962041 RepID=UPI0020B82C8D|nr:site-specific DNA-methyltransferase [Paenibacillus sp. Lou8.1]MCP3806611.1 site-specific DNA-methyltransferase [Paenibacillus sp. Lou8.1]